MIIRQNLDKWANKDYTAFQEPKIMCVDMDFNKDSTNKDRAIRHGITRPKIIKTFHKNTMVQEDGCIVWTKLTNNNGYGVMCIAFNDKSGITYRNPVFAHRFAWALKHGMSALPIGGQQKGDRMVLNHICYNRKCVNTNHLEVILQSENNSPEKRRPRKPNDAIIADNLEDFMAQIANTDRG
jgi:hypothetical protein